MAQDTNSGALWGGRFSQGPAPEMAALSQSTHFDWVLARYDLTGSIAHAHALETAGLLTPDECLVLVAELERLRGLIDEGQLAPDPDDEDVHGALERMLVSHLGPELGGKLRAGRSRRPWPRWHATGRRCSTASGRPTCIWPTKASRPRSRSSSRPGPKPSCWWTSAVSN